MTVVFEGEVFVEYSQAYVGDGGGNLPRMDRAFGGQANGLCGAAAPGWLFLVTGLHTGAVPFTVEVFDTGPPVPPGWQDVVEVSFTTPRSDAMLLGWAGGSADRIGLGRTGSFRVRYCAQDFAVGREADHRLDDEEVLDRYLLQFWPAPPRPDVIVRVSGPDAAYWHDHAATLPPPPSAEELAAVEELARQRDLAAREAAARIRRWDGPPPSPRLQSLHGQVLGVARTDRDLLDVFEALGPDRQRDTARWLARRAFEIAEIDQLEWVAPALAAMDRGDPLPAPFTSPGAVHDRLRPTGSTQRPVAVATVHSGTADRAPTGVRRIHRPSFAVPAIFSATDPDPLQAVVDTFAHAAATFNEQRQRLIDELRTRTTPDPP